VTDLAIAAPNEAAADAGEQVVRAGGNAVDAALAAALVTMINEVGVVSLSSGGFVTVQPGNGSPAYTVDGWMDMPGRDGVVTDGTWDVTTQYGGGIDITIGPGSVAVHGAVAALGETQLRDGRLPWRDVVSPAIEVARAGFELSSASRFYLAFVGDAIFGWDAASRTALHDEAGAVSSEPIVMPDLVRSLETIAEQGPRALHDGELAHLISADVIARGGLLGMADLAAYRPVVRPALLTQLDSWTVATTRPPSVGGACLLAMLRLLDGRVHGGWDHESREVLVRAQRAVLAHRRDVLEPSTDLEADVRALLDLIDGDPGAVLESASTAHVSTADSDGLACSVTVSSGYGSGMIAEGTGIWLNNCLGEQELNPAGLHALAPGARLLSNMAPSVARSREGSTLAIGSPGADRITTAIAQVLAGYTTGAMSLEEAICHPRVHVHHAGRADEDLRVETDLTMYFGGVGAAMTEVDGALAAVADPRRNGVARVVRC
jgi:gamma-glutamyltranspeptidase / glutathione hydrolase